MINLFKKRQPAFMALIALLLSMQLSAQTESLPFEVLAGLFDFSQPETLGLSFAPGTETVSIFKPEAQTDHYSNGVVLMPFRGYLYAQWQSSSEDEDGDDTWVAYSRSPDGIHWCKPMVLAPKWDEGIYTSGGWWVDGDTLVAYLNVWPQGLEPEGGSVLFQTSTDGIHWSSRQSLLNQSGLPVEGIIEQDMHALPDGRVITAIHEQPGLVVVPYFTDDARGMTGWTKGCMAHLPFEGTVSRELEPSWFYRTDGAVVMIFRDQASSFRKLASVSFDRGATWSTPVVTEMPDSRAKQSAGNLPDGTAFQVNNPSQNKTRFPLVIVLSLDGLLFDCAFLLRAGGRDLQPLRYEGKYKRIGYHYPKSVVWNDCLYIGYATNKEDVELTRVPMSSLGDTHP